MRTKSKIFKALSEKTRLEILKLLLKKKEMCVGGFVEKLKITQSKASRHLRYLVNVGLLNDRQEAVRVYFRISDNPEPVQAQVLEMLKVMFNKPVSSELVKSKDNHLSEDTSNPITTVNTRTDIIGSGRNQPFFSQKITDKKGWTMHLSPDDRNQNNMFLPIDSAVVDKVVGIISKHIDNSSSGSQKSQQHKKDFLITAQLQLSLANEGANTNTGISSNNDILVTATMSQYVLRLKNLQQELQEVITDYQPKLLLVDDEKEFVLTLSERLETRNMKSVIAYNGEEALAIVEKDTPDVMVVDINMPGIDGFEVLRRVRLEKPATKVIILTGHASEQEEHKAMTLGALAYLIKPVNIDVLATTCKTCNNK